MSRLHGDGLGLPVSGATGLPVAFTPAIAIAGGSTITIPTGAYIHLPGLILVWGNFNVSVAGASSQAITISPPPGYATLVYPPSTLAVVVGSCQNIANNSVPFPLTFASPNANIAGITTVVTTGNWGYQYMMPVPN